MRILFISSGGPTQDYLRDCVYHGLRTLLGPDVIDVGKLDSMYIGADRSQMYGRGFTLYALLPDLPVDRTDIPRKLATRYFDLIIYGSIHRNQDYIHEVNSMYDAAHVIFLDGEDHPGFLSGFSGVTFKRELYNPQPHCLPIHFAIPAEKILPEPPSKTRLMAPLDPINKATYIYTDESSYYAQYASAYYAATMKKAGWDCLRHYEIMSQWCLPYFRVFDQCPPLICSDLPRAELLIIKHIIEYAKDVRGTDMYDFIYSPWSHLIEPVMDSLRKHMTTTALATYIFDSIGVVRKETTCAS